MKKNIIFNEKNEEKTAILVELGSTFFRYAEYCYFGVVQKTEVQKQNTSHNSSIPHIKVTLSVNVMQVCFINSTTKYITKHRK